MTVLFFVVKLLGVVSLAFCRHLKTRYGRGLFFRL